MELTDAQKKTIEALGLEVVEKDRYEPNQWCVNEEGQVWPTGTYSGNLYLSVVVRPALAARVKELEEQLRRKTEQLDNWKNTLYEERDARTALESELAPIRALKVGSLPWALSVLASGGMVADKDGDTWSIKDERLGFIVSRDSGLWVCSEEAQLHNVAPFTLHAEPPPAPTAVDLCAAIEATAKAWPEVCRVGLFGDAVALAAAYRAANAKGGV